MWVVLPPQQAVRTGRLSRGPLEATRHVAKRNMDHVGKGSRRMDTVWMGDANLGRARAAISSKWRNEGP